jgi:hypothetical protein
MNFGDALIWLVVLVELALCITILLVICRVLRGVNITVNVRQENAPAPEAQQQTPLNIDRIQEQLDKLEQERREGEQQLNDLIGSINQFMTGGNDNG